jgi:8-oxo-dGTP pyrophosphatase MutT (NUDIX family)
MAQDGEPRYLLIKRHALSGKIERVAPKGKIQGSEDIQKAALREVSEETGIPINQIKVRQQLGTTQLRNTENQRGQMDKDVTYFLMEFAGNPEFVKIEHIEGYVGIHKRCTLNEVLALIYYQDIRELIRKSYVVIKDGQKNLNIKKDFINKLG